MLLHVGTIVAILFWWLLAGSGISIAQQPISSSAETSEPPAQVREIASPAAALPRPPTREVSKPPTVRQALDHGVVIVVSLPTQRMFVFKDGSEWGSAPVSTGRQGHETPAGVFPILQKSVAHRSTLYHDAPMPYMQRLTWGGVAMHGGNVSRYRASHGCIRLPRSFARKLYKITSYRSTLVLVTRSRVASPATALALTGGRSLPAERSPVELDAHDPSSRAAPSNDHIDTIQLAAMRSRQSAERMWDDLVERQPQLAQLQHEIASATINSLRVYRLRAFGPEAAAICRKAASEGVDCFRVAE